MEQLKLNVGGTRFETHVSTLPSIDFITHDKLDKDGYYFIDRDPNCFEILIRYLRTKRLTYPCYITFDQLKAEGDFWKIPLDNIGANRVTLNVGGRFFDTTFDTFYGPMADKIKSGMFIPEQDGSYFFDRDPDCFEILLRYSRTKDLAIPKMIDLNLLETESDFWQIDIENEISNYRSPPVTEVKSSSSLNPLYIIGAGCILIGAIIVRTMK